MTQFIPIVAGDGSRTFMRMPVAMNFAPPAFTWTSDPVLTSPDSKATSPLTVTPGTTNLEGATYTYAWYAGGVLVAGVTGTTWTPGASYEGADIHVVQGVAGQASATSNTVSLESTAEAGAWPADLTPSLVEYSEIRDPDDPDAGTTGGRRRWTFGTLPSTPGYELRRSANTNPGGTAPGQLCESGQSYLNSVEYPVGTTVYAVLFWYRQSDGATRRALPASGTTAGAAADGDGRAFPRALSAVSGDAAHGQLAITIVGLEAAAGGSGLAALAQVPSAARTKSLAYGNTRYDEVGSHFQSIYWGRACVINAFAAYQGDASAVTWTVGQINAWLASGGLTSAQFEGGYYAQHEENMAAVAFLALRTPAVVAQLSAAKQEALGLAIETGLYTGAFCQSSANTLSPERTLRGRSAAIKGVNPNISCANIGLVVLAVCHFGLSEALAKLAAFDKTSWRNVLNANGLLNQAYLTYNGYTGSTTSPVAVPTAAQMATALNTTPYKIRGRTLATDMQAVVLNEWGHIFGTDASGAEETVGGAATGIRPGIKWVQGKDAAGNNPDGNVGVPHRVTGTRRGKITTLTDGNYDSVAAAFPFNGETGQIKEMNAVDDGGQRSSASYAIASWMVFAIDLMCLAITQPAWFDWNDPAVAAMLVRARRGSVHFRAITEAGYLNVAKANAGGSNSETWTIAGRGQQFALLPTASFIFDVLFRWTRDSGILPPLAGGLAQWEAPVDWAY